MSSAAGIIPMFRAFRIFSRSKKWSINLSSFYIHYSTFTIQAQRQVPTPYWIAFKNHHWWPQPV